MTSWSPEFSTRPEILGTFGVVASTHWLASTVGMGVLERGGNAFDAAAAAGFTLQVAEPHLNGPAGDAPINLRRRLAIPDGVQIVLHQGAIAVGRGCVTLARAAARLGPLSAEQQSQLADVLQGETIRTPLGG